MKKVVIILFFIPIFSFSQYFIPFVEDSLYYSGGGACRVQNIFVEDTFLYIGGYAVDYGGTAQLYEIGKFFNNNWHSMDNGLGHPLGDVKSICKYHNKIYIGGNFDDIDGVANTENIGRFNGTTWEGLPNSVGELTNDVYDMTIWNDMLIIGGAFKQLALIIIIFLM